MNISDTLLSRLANGRAVSGQTSTTTRRRRLEEKEMHMVLRSGCWVTAEAAASLPPIPSESDSLDAGCVDSSHIFSRYSEHMDVGRRGIS